MQSPPPGLGSAIAALLLGSDLVGRHHALEGLAEETFAEPAPANLPEVPGTWTNPRSVDRAIGFLEDKKLMTPGEFSALKDGYKAAGFKIAGVQNKAMLGVARESLADSVAKGRSLEQATADLQSSFTASGYSRLDPAHARLVAHMASASGYNAGSWEGLHDPRVRQLIPYYRYLTRHDDRVRESHAAMHNKFFPRDHPIWKVWWPPNGYNCRCRVVGVTVNTVNTYGITEDKWPRSPENKARRVMPDVGEGGDFSGSPGQYLNRLAPGAAGAKRSASSRASAGVETAGPLGPVQTLPPGRPTKRRAWTKKDLERLKGG